MHVNFEASSSEESLRIKKAKYESPLKVLTKILKILSFQ